MKYCPYCGTVLIDGAVSFCAECGKKLPVKDEERGISQNNDHDEAAQEATGSGIQFQKEKISGKRSQKSSQKRNVTRSKEQPAKKPEQISETAPKDDYDGYYDDVLPADEGRFSEGMDKTLIKKVVVIIGTVLLIVTLCVGMMYAL